jgi:hypothetical protein
MEQLEPTNISTYCPSNPAFDRKRVLLCRLFFLLIWTGLNTCVGFYPSPDYLPLVEFVFVRRCGGPKTFILSDE